MIVAPLLATVALACPATPVHYEWNRLSPTQPWITASGLVGQLLGTYEPTLGDRRVREGAGLTLYAGALHKIGWLPRRWEGTGRTLRLVAERLDGPGRLTYRFPRALAPQFFPSGITLPTAGCWRLTLTSGSRLWVLHARAVEPPAAPPCDTTRVDGGPNSVDPTFTTWIAASPRRARIFATISVSLPGVEGAAIHVGGRKVLWLVERPAGLLHVRAVRLDGPQAEVRRSLSPASSPVYAYPSRLDLPEAGCWLVRLRTNGRAGVVVMRALDS
ncbi:MAG: hypothetical protein WD981_06595 [Gaiellaceae bacterium]